MEIKDILSHFDGNKTRAAEALRVSRPTIYSWEKMPELPEHAKMRMRDYLLRSKGAVPKKWMQT